MAPWWVRWSLWGNGLLAIALITIVTGLDRAASKAIAQVASQVQQMKETAERAPSQAVAATVSRPTRSLPPAPDSYEGSVRRRRQEAAAMAQRRPTRLAVLTGDSLSLAFPVRLLPNQAAWLNQGVSGETTRGLLRRLSDISQLQPEAIFVAIGINDLLQGVGEDTIVENQRAIVRELRSAHPRSRIVLQSLLPHRGRLSTWEGRARLERAQTAKLKRINNRLAQVARDERVDYLNLFAMFSDNTGILHPDLTTDGLHLSDRGYLVWRAALDSYLQLLRSSAASLSADDRQSTTPRPKALPETGKATPTPKTSSSTPASKPRPASDSARDGRSSTTSPSPRPSTPAAGRTTDDDTNP
ncbi:MAG: hypothetical protein EA001_11470 [Oscillatoriales cyanobacterium]|nr:MAG: hypothetical protein EA001_11470 [Oscillatoriales cyanobacterium]